ncbi:hypothetical protein FJ955_03075 [Mesorhizobium sp. B2-2-2]|uniref:hypothetical protein n=1 Tax=Mesorhizobium sp. B2-2-2 TaxID=2589964 RepID=UPI0011277A25|nr:hypothetical protein [Mesorhizobium sp. B2-2-2]TPM33737.1 hypothetical protein FJ955_03075 [Mesorhizobium sp. B2-2-2]
MNSFIFDGNKPRAPMTREEQMRAQMAIAGQMPTDLGSGISAVGQALMYRKNKNGSFPAAPGANPLSGLLAFGSRGSGGLY